MTAPVRLLDSSKNPRARQLLRAGVADGPKPAARRAAALALGVGASVTVTTTAAATSTALTAPSLALVAAKWIAIGTLGGVALAGAASGLSSLARAGTERTKVTAKSVPAAPRATDVVVTAPPVPEEPSAPETETASPAAAAQPIAAAKSASAPAVVSRPDPSLPTQAALPTVTGLAEEVGRIDAARKALAAGDARGALVRLDEFAALDRTGTLAREAQLIRIEALVRAGNQGQAVALAEQYLSRYPKDPHALRLHSLLGDRSRPNETISR